MDLLWGSLNPAQYSKEEFFRIGDAFVGGMVIGTMRGGASVVMNNGISFVTHNASKIFNDKSLGKTILNQYDSSNIVSNILTLGKQSDNKKINELSNKLIADFEANGQTFDGLENKEGKIGKLAIMLTEDGQNAFSSVGSYNPFGKIDNIIARISEGEAVTNQELMLFNITANRNRFKTVTGIDLSGKPVDVRNRLNSLIADGKAKKAIYEVSDKIAHEGEITDSDIDILVDNKEYFEKNHNVTFEGETREEMKASARKAVEQLQNIVSERKKNAEIEAEKSRIYENLSDNAKAIYSTVEKALSGQKLSDKEIKVLINNPEAFYEITGKRIGGSTNAEKRAWIKENYKGTVQEEVISESSENQRSENLLEISSENIKNTDVLSDLNKARNDFVQHYKKNFPKYVYNENTNQRIDISRKGIDKFLSGNITPEKYATGYKIPYLVETAQKTGNASYKKEGNAKKENIQGYDYYENKVSIDEKPYKVYIRVRKTPMGDKYYGHTISRTIDEIKIEPVARTYDNSPLQPVYAEGSTINDSIPQSDTSVKNKDMQKNKNNASKTEEKQTPVVKSLLSALENGKITADELSDSDVKDIWSRFGTELSEDNSEAAKQINLLLQRNDIRGRILMALKELGIDAEPLRTLGLENDISLYKGENREILEKLQERMNVVFNPSLKTARYVPSAEPGKKDTVYLRNDKDIIHESFHAIARAVRDGRIPKKKYESLFSELINSEFFTEHILGNESFKKSLFNEENGFDADFSENIGTYEEFYDAMYELYGEEYRSDYEKQGYSGEKLDSLVENAIDEEIFAFALQELDNIDDSVIQRMFSEDNAFQRFIQKLKDIWNNIVASFKGEEASDLSELKFARKMADKFNKMYQNTVEDGGTVSGEIRFSKEELSELRIVDKKFKQNLYKYKTLSGFVYDLGNSPKWINNSPLSNKRIDVTPNIIEKAVEKHNIPVENLENLVYEIQNPVMAFPSISENVKEGTQNVVALTNIKNEEGVPVVCSILLDAYESKILVDRITSIQRKDNVFSFLERSIEASKNKENYINGKMLLYVDKEKVTQWSGAIGLQSSKLHKLIELLNDTLPHLNMDVNSNFMRNSKKDANSRSSKQIPIEFSEKLINDTDKSFSEKQGILKSRTKSRIFSDFSVPLNKRTEINGHLGAAFGVLASGGEISPEMKNNLLNLLFDNSNSIDKESVSEYEGLKSQLKKTKLYFSPELQKAFSDPNGFQKSAIGKINLSNLDGQDVSKVYKQLAEEYPELFDSDIVGSDNQLREILSVARELNGIKSESKTTKEEFLSMMEKAFSDYRLENFILKLKNGKTISNRTYSFMVENHASELSEILGIDNVTAETLKGYNENLENVVDKEYNEIKDELYSELLYGIPIKKIKMKVFPSDKESWSEANQLSVRWAHKDSIESGARKVISYHDKWYVIEKYDSFDLKYQIVGIINTITFNKIRNEVHKRERRIEKKSASRIIDGFTNINETRDRSSGRGYSSVDNNVEYRGENYEFRELDENQIERWEFDNNSGRGNEQSVGNRGQDYSIEKKSKQTITSEKSSESKDNSFQDYTEQEYRDYGWARANDILSAGQNADYRSKFAMAKSGMAKFPKSKNGEYIIPVSNIYDSGTSGINNVLVFAKGKIDKPVITSIIEIYEYDETKLDTIRRSINGLERRGIQQKTGGIIRRYNSTDFIRAEYGGRLYESGEDNHGKRFGNDNRRKANSIEEENNGTRYSKQTIEPYTAEEITEKYDELIKKYGSIKQGEKAEREIKVPKKSSHNKYVSRFARTMAESSVFSDDNISEFERLVVSGKMSHEVISDKYAMDNAERKIKEHGFKGAVNFFIASVDDGFINKELIGVGQALLNQAYTNKDTETAIKLATSLSIAATTAGQSVQAQRMLKKMTPDGQLYFIEKTVQKINRQLEKRFEKKSERKKTEIPKLDIDPVLASELLHARTSEEIAEAVDAIEKDLGHQIPVTFSDKWNEWRYLAMLGNAKTHIRNIAGNAGFTAAVVMKNITGTALEKILIPPEHRTKSVILSKGTKEFALKDYEKVKDIISGEDKYTEQTKIMRNRQIYKKWKVLEKARNFNSNLLEKEDLIFSKMHYVNALAQIMTARGITAKQLEADTKGTNSLLEQIRTIAIKQAQRNTFREFNEMANAVSRAQRKLNEKGGGYKALSWIIEGNFPFKSTPMNIAKQGLRYSPIGFVKALTYDLVRMRDGKITATEVIDNLSSGLVGTGMALLGFFLAKAGILELEPEEEKERKLNEQMGGQNLSLNIGGMSFTIDWISPASMPVAVGANIYTNFVKKNHSTTQAVVDALSMVTEPFFELSCLQGINSTLETISYKKGSSFIPLGINSIVSYFSQAFPTLGGQFARLFDSTKRQTYIDKQSYLPDFIQKFIQDNLKKVPFASKLLAPQLDMWGNERKQKDNLALRAGEQFLSPGYIEFKTNDPVEKEMKRLIDATGKTEHIPTVGKKYVTYKGEQYYFTRQEYLSYYKIRGRIAKAYLITLINSQEYREYSDDDKVKKIKSIFDKASDIAKSEVIKKSEHK